MNKWIVIIVCLWTNLSLAQEQKGEHWYELAKPAGEWCELHIPNEIYRELQGDFSSLRIYSSNNSGDTLEVPYLIRNNLPNNQTHQVEFELFNESTKGDSKYFTFKPNSDELLNRMNLNIEDKEFDARIRLEGSKDQKEWFTILDDYRILSLNKDNIQFSYTDLEFSPVDYTYLRLELPTTLTFQSAYLIGNFSEGGIENVSKTNWKVKEVPEKKQTEILISLDEYTSVRSFEIQIADNIDYFRNSSLYYLKDSTNYLEKWHKNYKRIYSGDLTSVRDHREIFNMVFTNELKFVIHNADNQPLSIKDITVKGNTYSIIGRFKDGYQNHYLSFQHRKTRAPKYDIARFQDNIPEDLGIMSLGNATFIPYPSTEKEPFFKSNWWVWGAMILVIIVLGRFTIQMLKDS